MQIDNIYDAKKNRVLSERELAIGAFIQRIFLLVLCLVLFQNSSFSENDKNSLKGKSNKYTGITGKAGDVNFGDSFEKCKDLFKSEGFIIDSTHITENTYMYLYVSNVKIYGVVLNNCKFEFDLNGLHTMTYHISEDENIKREEIEDKSSQLIKSLKKHYKKFNKYNQITHSLGENGCFSSSSVAYIFEDNLKEVNIVRNPADVTDNTYKGYYLEFYQHYNFPKVKRNID